MDKIVNKETEVFGGGTLEHENNISVLRILAFIMVIAIHVSSFYVINYAHNDGIEFIIGNLWDSFSRPAVPIFVMICGKYALDNQNNSSILKYYKKIFKRIYLITFLYSFLYTIYKYFFMEKYTVKNLLNHWLAGEPFYHLWYLYMMIGIYLLVPFLIKLKNKIGEKKFRSLGIKLLFLSFIIVLFRDFSELSNITILKYYWKLNQFKFINYLGYFILGYSLRNIKLEIKKGIIFSLVSGIVLFLTVQIFKAENEIIHDYNYPWVVIYSIFLYLTFLQLKIKKNKILVLDKYTFEVYLIHAFILLINIKYFHVIPIIFRIPLKIIITFIISLSIVIVIRNIKRRL